MLCKYLAQKLHSSVKACLDASVAALHVAAAGAGCSDVTRCCCNIHA